MRPRSLPWLLLHAFAILAGTVALFRALGTPAEALQTSYGQGSLVGTLIWPCIAVFAMVKLYREYGGDAGNSGNATPVGHAAYVAMPMQAAAHPPRSAPFECDTFIPAPHGMLPPARGSVPPPRG